MRFGGYSDIHGEWLFPDTVMIGFMKTNRIKYGMRVIQTDCCTIYCNNLWVSNSKEIVPLVEFYSKNWYRLGIGHNDSAFRHFLYRSEEKQRKLEILYDIFPFLK